MGEERIDYNSIEYAARLRAAYSTAVGIGIRAAEILRIERELPFLPERERLERARDREIYIRVNQLADEELRVFTNIHHITEDRILVQSVLEQICGTWARIEVERRPPISGYKLERN